MILDSANAEAASQLVADGGWEALESVRFSDATMAGVVDLARSAVFDGRDAGSAIAVCLGGSERGMDVVSTVQSLFDGQSVGKRMREDIFAAPTLELWSVRSWDCLEESAFSLYIQRFERSVRRNGFGARFPAALASAFTEMIENVPRHSAAQGQESAVGVLGYHVLPGSANYVVADLGRGVLASLKESPEWHDLPDEQAALVAVARDGATRIRREKVGFGFKQVFRSFLDREGVVALRSRDGVAVLKGNTDRKVVETSSCAAVPGLRVSVCVSTSRPGEENLI